MSKNIKEIGKELLGKSLNSFHRKTGLTQLEKNNEMQDGILDGILSQVDDAYIEKTEQSNVIHLEGSGDGVVVLDSIEGNTMVNLCVDKTEHINKNYTSSFLTKAIKHNTEYTVAFELFNITQGSANRIGVSIENAPAYEMNFANFTNGFHKVKVVTRGNNEPSRPSLDLNENVYACFWIPVSANGLYSIKNVVVLEGDWTEKEIPYFEGIQSSFEEKVNDEGKYEIEILSNNKNLCKITEDYKLENANGLTLKYNKLGQYIEVNGTATSDLYLYNTTHNVYYDIEALKAGTTYTCSLNIVGNVTSNSERSEIGYFSVNGNTIACRINNDKSITKIGNGEYSQYTPTWIRLNGGVTFSNCKIYLHLEKGVSISNYEPYKQNKIKLLINEPLRAVDDTKDRLCVKDGKLVIERNTLEVNLTSDKNYDAYAYQQVNLDPIIAFNHSVNELFKNDIQKVICDKLPYDRFAIHQRNVVGIASFRNDGQGHNTLRFGIHKNTLGITGDLDNISYSNELKVYLRDNPMKVITQLAEPIYEEVLNEYGEPIILEGYENGTLYIDSVIVPTTTVKYTPKMESFKTLKEVNKNNNLITLDINENIIPYMMDVDYMIMEKELCLLNTKNIRKMEVLDMTSMQKRTQDMLERLIKGKTLTEQECKTRVTTYLHAGKITDEQAEELMLLIDEVYA